MTQQFLPVCKKDMTARGWTQPDFIFITADAYVDHPVMLMQKMDCDAALDIPVWKEYEKIVAKYDDRGADAIGNYERFAFYDEARTCYCIVQTGETSIYANVILQKGVVK